MHVRLLLFGPLRDGLGARSLQLELDPGATVATALERLAARAASQQLTELLDQPFVVARNGDWARVTDSLSDGDELALVPPVSGGSPACEVVVSDRRLETEEKDTAGSVTPRELAGAGAQVVFEGRTRDVEALEYEAYLPLAEAELRRIANEVAQRHGIALLRVAHRVGRVPRGQASVRVEAHGRHRAETFAAVQEVVDQLKQRVPIWKVEVSDTGCARPAGQLPPQPPLTLRTFCPPARAQRRRVSANRGAHAFRNPWAMNRLGQLIDAHGRIASDLRVSVTDRCNLRCRYCMPAQGLPWMPREALLERHEITRLVQLFATLGIKRVRLTGGEPLLRRDLPQIARDIAATTGIERVAITTNGVLLEQLAEPLARAGVTHFNVSLDALTAKRFQQITRRAVLPRVLAGLERLERTPGVKRIKVNVVALPDLDDDELFALVELAQRKPYELRFLEYMPLAAGRSWRQEQLVSGAQLRRRIARRFRLVELQRPAGATARRFRIAGSDGVIGFVSPVSEPFCASCNRLRLTADGAFKSCLFGEEEVDLAGPLRAGATDRELASLIRAAVWRKPKGHAIGQTDFRQPRRSMSRVGG